MGKFYEYLYKFYGDQKTTNSYGFQYYLMDKYYMGIYKIFIDIRKPYVFMVFNIIL